MRHLAIGLILFLSGHMTVLGQSYPPAAGLPGSTAIMNDSPLFTAWATGINVTRGYVNISNPGFTAAGSNYATAGQAEYALGYVDGNSVSLGDGGLAILTFASPIENGEGFDFAVFETGTSDYLELAFVEVSSDGINYFRFPNHSQTQTSSQVGTFGSPLPQYLNNLAGKYSGAYGTPFDLSDIADNSLLDKDNITHVKIIDVRGSINPAYAAYDSLGNAVNESFPTPFASCGFDLQGVGVIHQKTLGLDENRMPAFAIYPNPAGGYIKILGEGWNKLAIYNASGSLVLPQNHDGDASIDISLLSQGVYFVHVAFEKRTERIKLVKL